MPGAGSTGRATPLRAAHPEALDPNATWHVEVEVLLLRLLPHDRLGHRWVRGPLLPDTSPDARAVELAGCTHGVCHSTSWRCDRPGRLVLTYAALPDPHPELAGEPLGPPFVVSGGAALRPTPAHLDRQHVAAHAVRHLADLAERDPVVRAQGLVDPLLWRAVAAAGQSSQHRRQDDCG